MQMQRPCNARRGEARSNRLKGRTHAHTQIVTSERKGETFEPMSGDGEREREPTVAVPDRVGET